MEEARLVHERLEELKGAAGQARAVGDLQRLQVSILIGLIGLFFFS